IAPAHVARFVTSKPEHFFKLNVGLSNLMKAYVALCRLKKNPESCRLTSVKPAAHTGWEREKDGGLTEEERDAVARDLGIFPPPDMFPMPAKPQPAPVTEKEP
ncbi:MAG: hypothetical protein JWM16_3843, partial [Verrucomicrobiales bacterium]|nr:hypothetical protein [Verrucomicrobiales bacterium]